MVRFKTVFYESYDENWIYDYHDKLEEHIYEILNDFLNGVPKIKWNRVKAPRLIKIWKDFGEKGILRDEKGIYQIKNSILNNIIRLDATTALQGHTEQSPTDLIERAGFEEYVDLDEDEEQSEKFYYDYMSGDDSGYVSDYGLPKLQKLYPELYNEQDPEKLLYIIDKVLNVVHQRSDLATIFIEGGTSTLLQISNYQPDTEEDDY
jgi:hypothetical protein